MSQLATVFATTNLREVGDGPAPIVKNFRALAATSYVAGQFVTIDTAGRVVIVTANDQAIDGIIFSSVDNTAGAADAVNVPVIVKGNCWVDGFFTSAGSYSGAAAIGYAMTNYGDGTVCTTGQGIVYSTGMTNKLFISLAVQALGTGVDFKRKMLVFFKGSAKYS